jgi:hypothetical protein
MFSKRILILLIVFVAFTTAAHAEYFSDYKAKPADTLRFLSYTVAYAPSWSAGGVDHWVAGDLNFRLSRHWAIPAEAFVLLGRKGAGLVIAGRWFPVGKLGRDGYEDWLQIELGQLIMTRPWDPGCTSSCNDWDDGFLAGVNYGRDIQPWKNSHYGFRLSIGGAWVQGTVLSRASTGIFGIPQTKLGNVMLSLRIGIMEWEN